MAGGLSAFLLTRDQDTPTNDAVLTERTPTTTTSSPPESDTSDTESTDQAPSETACSYLAAPEVGEYVVILDPPDPLFQNTTSLGEACDFAGRTGGDVLDSTSYWGLNLDNGHKSLWTVIGGSYATKSAAERAARSYGYDPDGSDAWRVRWIGPCDREDGYACVR